MYKLMRLSIIGLTALKELLVIKAKQESTVAGLPLQEDHLHLLLLLLLQQGLVLLFELKELLFKLLHVLLVLYGERGQSFLDVLGSRAKVCTELHLVGGGHGVQLGHQGLQGFLSAVKQRHVVTGDLYISILLEGRQPILYPILIWHLDVTVCEHCEESLGREAVKELLHRPQGAHFLKTNPVVKRFKNKQACIELFR